MNDKLLKDFGAHAETLVEIPDFAQLDKRGRDLRIRRRAGAAGAPAAVGAVAGVVTPQPHRPGADDGPVNPPPIKTRTFPSGTMKTVEPGPYRLHPSLVESDPTA